ncbi:hypothetical protein J5751_04795 [bacterium]|nr:hypothetical protein [bacterium]
MIIHNLEMLNEKRLISNETYAYLMALRELKESLPEVENGLDYYKMWLSQYNHCKNNLSAKSNVENFFCELVENRKEFFKVITYLEYRFKMILRTENTQKLNQMLDFIFDEQKLPESSKKCLKIDFYIFQWFNAIAEILKEYWG